MRKLLPAILIVFMMFMPVIAFGCPVIRVCFTPGGNCTGMIVSEIDSARSEVLVQAYSFTSAPIAKALVEAFRRGIHVEAILDKSQETERYSSATFLAHAGIPVLIDHKHAIPHNKIVIIDRREIITGSFNFTRAAQKRNAENLLVIQHDRKLVGKYLDNYHFHRDHSEPYRRHDEKWKEKHREKRHRRTYY